jgi:hypothetical protein
MTRQRTIQIIALICLVLCVAGAAALMEPINTQRKDLQLDMGLENTTAAVPPNIILETAALGSFRGLLVDFLWYRVNQLKEEGKFYEINTLSQFITTLQPRFPQVWAFHAWNMAYNISVTTNTPQERWSWVNNGIRLLRDQGIIYNPRAVRLYRELSWIYFHKVGQMSDDMHWYYKSQLAREWEEILGVPNPDASTSQVIDRFRLVADALPTLRQVRASSPEAAELLDKLTALGVKPDEQFLRKIDRLMMFTYSQDARLLGVNLHDLPRTLGIQPQVIELIQNPKYGKAFPTLLAHLRKRVIVDVYHMKPQKMLSLMEEFGPIDWRHPAAHGEYWASLGVDVANELRDPTSADLLNTYRQKLHSFQDLTRSGRIVFDPLTGTIDMLPDPRFIPAYDKAFNDAIAMAERTKQKHVETSYGPGHENFLLMATVYMYLYGDQAEAQKYFLRAKKLYGDTDYNKRSGRYNDTIEELVFDQFKDIRDMTSSTRQFIDAMVLKGISEGLVNYDPAIFNRFLKIARTGYDKYDTGKVATPLANQGRMSLQPFGELVVSSYVSFMKSSGVNILSKARVWYNTPPQIKEHAYAQLREILDTQATQAGLDPARAFPPPEGWKPPDASKAEPLQPPDHPENNVHVERK